MSDEPTEQNEAALTAEEIGWLAEGAWPLRVPETVFRAARRIKAQARREGAADMAAKIGRYARPCPNGSPGACLSIRCGSNCNHDHDRMHPCLACIVQDATETEPAAALRGDA